MHAVNKLFATPYVAYGLAVVVVAIAALLQSLAMDWVGSTPSFAFFLLPVLVTVIFLGRGPAVIVLVWGIVDGFLLADPMGATTNRSAQDIAAVSLFAASGLLIVGFGNRLRFTTARAALAEQRLALAQRNTGVGIFELDFDARTAFVSQSLCHMLGREYKPGKIDLALWLGGLREDHVEESRRAMQAQIARGELRYEREQKIVRPDGELRWVLNRVELEAATNGRLRIARGVAVDITERKRTDELLQHAQDELKQQLHDLGRLHSFSQNLLAAGDDLPAALRSLLDVALEIYGVQHGIVSLNETAGGTCVAVARSGFPDELIEKHAQGSADEQHLALAGMQNLQGLQSMPLLSARGEIMGMLSVMSAAAFGHCERERRLTEVCTASAAAIVERERARTAAIKNEKRFSVALESSVVPFTILTPVRSGDHGPIVDFLWTYLNPAAARALGREVADLLGRVVGTVLPQAWETPELFSRYVGALESGQQCEFEIRTNATNQGVRWYNVLAAPLQGSVAVWFTNITARKKNEETLSEADRRKDEFLATLAHELRNPLAPIRQSTRIAAATNSTEAQRRWSHTIIERQVQHMSLLLDDLLDVSRIGRGTLLLRKSDELFSVVMDTALEAARPHLEAKRHRLDKTLPTPAVVLQIDPVRIAQVLGNLLTNAAKYTDPGGHISVSAQREGEEFVIRVKDNGIGLTQDQQAQVFEMFSQVPAALEQSQGGLGIGLALARGLVELHGGSIRAVSAGLGQGTEIIVRLPGSCIVSDRAGAPVPTAAPRAAAGVESMRRILIADDNVDAADSLAELLRLDGYEVHVAYDGAAALALFSSVDPDAALLDVGMPNGSGLEVVRAIRQTPAGQRATLIAVTGWGQERDRRRALEAGFDHHLTKPIMPEVICDLIQRGRLSETL